MKIYTKVVIDINGNTIEEESFDYNGPLALCGGGGSGGGGQSGTVGWPEYMEDTHHNWLKGNPVGSDDEMTYSIVDLMNTAHGAGGNPYDGESSFDPNAALTLVTNSPLKKIDDQLTASKAILDAINPENDFAGYVAQAANEYTHFADITFLDSLSSAISGLLSAVESALSSTAISNMVSAFEDNKKPRFLRDIGMWSAGMADINAVHTSSFIIGLALQQIEFSNSVDGYEKELKGNIYNKIVQAGIDAYVKAQTLRVHNKDSMLIQGADLMSKLESLRSQVQNNLVQLKAEIEKMTIVAMKEKTDRQLNIDVDEAKWDMEVYMYGTNVMASISGAAVGRMGESGMTTGQSVLGGAMAGASIGAAFGPIGAGIGFLAGGLLGWAFG